MASRKAIDTVCKHPGGAANCTVHGNPKSLTTRPKRPAVETDRLAGVLARAEAGEYAAVLEYAQSKEADPEKLEEMLLDAHDERDEEVVEAILANPRLTADTLATLADRSGDWNDEILAHPSVTVEALAWIEERDAVYHDGSLAGTLARHPALDDNLASHMAEFGKLDEDTAAVLAERASENNWLTTQRDLLSPSNENYDPQYDYNEDGDLTELEVKDEYTRARTIIFAHPNTPWDNRALSHFAEHKDEISMDDVGRMWSKTHATHPSLSETDFLHSVLGISF